MLKLYEVRDNGAFIGTYYAKNPKHAIQRAVDGLNEGAAAFKRSWTRVTLDKPTATVIEKSRG